MKKLWLLLAILAVAVMPAFAAHRENESASQQDEQTKAFMRAKLTHSQQILDGLTTENYDKIAKSAQSLSLLSNESTWNVFQTEEYIRMSREFRESSMRLRDAAHDKNLDGATLAYFEVTLSCVRCHKYTRDQRNRDK